MKRLTSIILCLAMLASLFTVSVSAATGEITVIVPEDVSKTLDKTVIDDYFDGENELVKTKDSTYSAALSLTGGVLDINTGNLASVNKGIKNLFWSKTFSIPSTSVGYTISFDFCRMSDDATTTSDYLQWQHFPSTAAKEKVTYRINPTQFDKGKWYHVKYTFGVSGSTWTVSGTKTEKESQTSSAIQITTLSSAQSGKVNQIGVYIYNAAAAGAKTMHYQMDNFVLSKPEPQLIETDLTTAAQSGAVQPLLAAYDSNGVLMTTAEATAGTLTNGTASADYDILEKITNFQNAKSVKALYWDGYANAKAYAPYVEIGDAISPAVGEATAVPETLNITSDMIPSGATGNYTVFAYATSFTAKANEIPAYDPVAHKLLVLDQFASKPTSVKYNQSLYDGSSQDIVVVVNADGASAAKVTLLEEVDPPVITNVVMQLGADESQRNFTWFSLKGDAGKLTYAKAEDFVDGAFPSDANVVTATRDSAEGEFSLKAHYYNNKATITGLEPNTLYYYQLSNDTDKTDMIPFTTGAAGSSFSFAFGGDAQVGGSENVDYDKETITWGRSVKQMVTDPTFSGVEFFVHGGDQVDSYDRTDGTATDAVWDVTDEKQYDIYINHDEFLSFPQVVTYGNHDLKTQGRHYQHFNEPNLPELSSILDGSAAGAAKFTAADGTFYPQTADHYFTYKSALFIVLNTNTFASSKTYSTTVEAKNKASAEKHAAFVKKVTDMYKDDPEIMWTIVLYHQSPYGSSYHGNYTYTEQADGSIKFGRDEQQAYTDMRKYLLPALDECGVDMVLSGHDHCYTRTHIIKPATDEAGNYTYADDAVITPYATNSYTFANGSTTPAYNNAWKDDNGKVWENLQVTSKPVKVTNPDGILHVTGATSSGSQVNADEYTNRFTAVNETAKTRHLSRIDITPTSLTLKTYNLGADNVESVSLVDQFTIERTAEVDVQGITLSENEVTVAAGLTKTLDYSFVPAEPTINNTVTWSSDSEGVATVKDGVVTGVSAGTANITVRTANGKTATCKVTVVDKVAVTGITLPQTLTMEALTTKTLTATVAPDSASEKGLEWTSSNDEIATVNQNGSITAHKYGNVTITATAKDGSGVSASCAVTITYVASTPTFPSSFSMMTNSEAQLTLKLTPDNATFKNVTWASSAPGVVTVDQNGKLSAIKPGTSNITATTPERTLTCVVTVTGGVLFEQNFEDAADKTLYNTFKDNNAEMKAAWNRVQDEDGNWVLDLNHKDITAKHLAGLYNSRTETASDVVTMPPASGYTVDFDFRKVSEGGLGAINFRLFDQNSVFRGFRINISSFDVGEWYDIRAVRGANNSLNIFYKKASSSTWVNGNGLKLSEYNGSTQLIFNYMDIMALYVSNASEITKAEQLKTHWQFDNIRTYVDVPAEDFALSGTSATMQIGDKYMLSPTFTPSNVTDNHIAYTSSNTAVATVDRLGNITAVGAGNATITAASSATGTSKTFAVTVAALEPTITLTQAVDGTNWKFTVSSENIVNGDTVYVGVYNSRDALIDVSSADFLKAGNELTIPQNSAAKYFKAFIWTADNAPCVPSKRIEN